MEIVKTNILNIWVFNILWNFRIRTRRFLITTLLWSNHSISSTCGIISLLSSHLFQVSSSINHLWKLRHSNIIKQFIIMVSCQILIWGINCPSKYIVYKIVLESSSSVNMKVKLNLSKTYTNIASPYFIKWIGHQYQLMMSVDIAMLRKLKLSVTNVSVTIGKQSE